MSALTPDETILGLLAVQPQHGYQLLEVFNAPEHLRHIWHLSTSQLYAVLKRLELKGWIVGEQHESPFAPPRTEYHITADGLTHFERWFVEPSPSPSVRRIRVEFLSRLYLARQLRRPTYTLIEHQRSACQAELERQQAQRDTASTGIETIALDLIIAQLGAIIHWLDYDLHPISVSHFAQGQPQ